MSDNPVLIYSAFVKKQLNEETLAAAFENLILYNEMLQVRLDGGRYVPQTQQEEESAAGKILFRYDCKGKTEDELSDETKRIIRDLSAGMRAERRASVRGALIDLDQSSCRLLLLLHRSIADPRAVVLLFEDIYRLYEQLSNALPPALLPVRKTYAKFIEEMSAATRANGAGQEARRTAIADFGAGEAEAARAGSVGEARKIESQTITIDRSLKRRMFSWRLAEFELKAVEVLTGAMLRSLTKAGAEHVADEDFGAGEDFRASVSIKSDYRFVERALEQTACALTHTYTLPPEVLTDDALLAAPQNLRGILRELALRARGVEETRAVRPGAAAAEADALLLNLEYMTNEPWLGGDEWLPEGFVSACEEQLSPRFLLEIRPLLFSDRIEVSLKFAHAPQTSALVERFAASLESELESILRYCEEYVDAKEFWIKEFTRDTPKTNIEVESEGQRPGVRGRASLPLMFNRTLVERAAESLRVDAQLVMLAAYSVLLSRLNGREDLVLVVAAETQEGERVFPFRLRPAWDVTFRQFVEDLSRKFEQAAATARYSFDILREEQPKHQRAYPVLDVGYTFKREAAGRDGHTRRDERPNATTAAETVAAVKLALQVTERTAGLETEWLYERDKFDSALINSFGSYLKIILEDVSANVDIALGRIQIGQQQNVHDAVQAIAQDAFNF